MEAKAKPDDGGITTGGSLMHGAEPDFSGWATRVGLKCADGRTILKDAFKDQDTATVPLVWQHNHNSPENVLGHAVLENRDEGVYCYGFFNDTDQANHAKTLVQHKDISSLSIYANQLKEKMSQVLHGVIREVSLVLSGANPGALIDNITLRHSDGDTVMLDDEAIIYTGEELGHEAPGNNSDTVEHSAEDPTIQEVWDSMTPDQQTVAQYLIGAAVEESKGSNAQHSANGGDEGGEHKTDTNNEEEGIRHMRRNVFEQQNGGEENEKHTLSHDALQGIVADAIKGGSLKAAFEDYALQHGIENLDVLFPEAQDVGDPQFDSRRVEWVNGVINGTNKSPFSRIRTKIADITMEEARAKGYIKGTMKKEEWFSLSKRVTTPATMYKKQKLDRDDILDITTLDVVAWMKGEMRLMFDEELARAILIGDGRDVDDEDKIKDPAGASEGAGIRSILNEPDLYAATVTLDIDLTGTGQTDVIDALLSHMRYYKGSGSPTFYTTLPVLTWLLLARDGMNRRYYRTASDLAAELGVSNIVTVEPMEDDTDVFGIIVNLKDYTIGADRGGETSFFDFFDIDYNQYKYLYEARLSGALTKIRSAVVVRKAAAGDTLVAPAEPSFDGTNIHINDTTGVTYKRSDTNATVTSAADVPVAAGESLKIYATADSGHYLDNNVDDEWTFSNDS